MEKHFQMVHSYLIGATVFGFWGLFDSDYGDPSTPQPYARVTPSANPDGKPLPFRCPNCPRVIAPIEIKQRHDRRRKHHWCPACNHRFCIVLPAIKMRKSQPLRAVAPSRVERVVDGELQIFNADPHMSVIGRFFYNATERQRMAIDVLGGVC